MMDETKGASRIMQFAEETDFVEVMFARSQTQASECLQLLLDRAIPARLEETDGPVSRTGVAILVPNGRMIEASELLAARVDDDADAEEVEGDEGLDDLDDDYDDEEDDDDDYDDDEDDFDDDDEEEEFEEEEEV